MISRKLLAYWDRFKEKEVSDIRIDKATEVSVLLVYPNTYTVGISSLSLQRIFELLSKIDGVACDLFFVPDDEEVVEDLEKGHEVASYYLGKTPMEFDIIMFSISYENDLFNIPRIMRYFRIPLFSHERGDNYPITVAGGIAVSENPEPYAPFFDVISVGDGEGVVEFIVEAYKVSSSKFDFLKTLSEHPSIYIPSFYETTVFNGFEIPNLGDKRLVYNIYDNFPQDPAKSVVYSENCVFGFSKIIEVSRGCPRKCCFCLASWIHKNTRFVALEPVKNIIESTSLKKIALLGTSVSDWPYLPYVLDTYKDKVFSFSSLRLDVKREVIDLIANYDIRTITFGIEAFSERLRAKIGKPYSDNFILERIAYLSGKFDVVKLYFMVGLPGESEEDVEESKRMLYSIREAFDGRVYINLSPFVPKPHTPFQFESFSPISIINKRMNIVRDVVKKLKNVYISYDLPKQAKYETIIARGDRKVGYWVAKKASIREELYLRKLDPSSIYPWKIVV